MPSRRAVVASGAVLAAGVGAASRIRTGPAESWSPPADAWPLDRYGPANTAANPDASVPSDPAVAWRRPGTGPTYETAVVVGPDAVYVSDAGYEDGLAALDRRDGSRLWRIDDLGGRIALHDGTLYAVNGEVDPAAAAFGLDPADGSRRWQTAYGDVGPHQVVVADDALLVVGESDAVAYGAGGGRRWTLSASELRPEGVAVHGGALYATATERVLRFRSRSLLDAALGRRPPSAWLADPGGYPQRPAVAGGRVVVGCEVTVGSERPAVVALDPATGEPVGGALRPGDVPTPEGARDLVVSTPAVDGDRGVAPYAFAGDFSDGDPPGRYGVVGVSLADGTVDWRRRVAAEVRDLAVGGDAAVVATGPDPEVGAVLALSRDDGSERWRVDVDAAVSSVALVDGTVFAGTAAGDVVALR